GVDVEETGQPPDRSEPGAGRAGAGETVAHGVGEVREPRAAVECQQADAAGAAGVERPQQQLAAAAVLHEIRRRFGHDDPETAHVVRGETEILSQIGRRASRVARAAGVPDVEESVLGHFHRVIVTLVPEPGLESMSKSLTRRRAPPRPRPRPAPVVKPSRSAWRPPGTRGPWSAKASRRPRRAPSFSDSRRTVPPPPYSTTLRASSLAAVTIFV